MSLITTMKATSPVPNEEFCYLNSQAESLMKIMNPTTIYERMETAAVLGENYTTLFKVRPNVPISMEEWGKHDQPISEDEEEPSPQRGHYKRFEHLRPLLRQVRRETIFSSKEEQNMPATIRFCFGDLFLLFNKKGKQKNFSSYGFFMNRILELHGKHDLKNRLGISEPKNKRALRRCEQLWNMYLDYIKTCPKI